MTAPVKIVRRSIYADKVREFSEFAFGDDDVFRRAGRWRTFFADRIGPAFDGRIVLEIGCADAAFLTRIAAKFPNAGFIGIDWKAKAVYDAAQRIAGASLSNVALLRGRAQEIERIFRAGEVDEIWIFHPEPCDREAELKNRLINEPFLATVHRVLRDDGSSLCLKTDHTGYFESIRELARVDAQFESVVVSVDYWNDEASLKRSASRLFSGEATEFEARFRKKRKPIYYIELQQKVSGKDTRHGRKE